MDLESGKSKNMTLTSAQNLVRASLLGHMADMLQDQTKQGFASSDLSSSPYKAT
jgi:hypothetical protein